MPQGPALPRSGGEAATFLKLGAARPVAFQGSADGATWTPLVAASSKGDGIAGYTFTPSQNRYHRSVFNGDGTLGPDASAPVRVLVAGTVTLTPNAGTAYSSIGRGTAVLFTATLRPWSIGRPRALVTFTLGHLVGSTWRAVASRAVRANTLGRAIYRFTFSAAGRWSVTARAGSTSAVVTSGASRRLLYRVH